MRTIALACLVLFGCGSDAPPDATKGEFCNAVADHICTKGSTCNLGTFDECFLAFKTSCCLSKHTCQDRFSTAAFLEDYKVTCGGAIDVQSCDQASKQVVPAACAKDIF
jgi:hypothetical protein